MKVRWIWLPIVVICACGGPPAASVAPRVPPAQTAPSEVRGAPVEATPSADAMADAESPIPIGPDDPVWGSRTALLTLVMIGDYQCPFTARLQATIEQLKGKYGPEKLRVVWKNNPLPFHQNARPAAEAAVGVFAMAGNDAFWKFHATAFQNQQTLTQESFVKWATAAGVAEANFRQGLEAHTWADKVDRDIALAKAVGANGTPHCIVNGVAISGAQPLDKFVEVFDTQLAKADAELAKGTSRERLYQKLSKVNFESAPPSKKEEASKEDDKNIWKVPIGASPVRGPDTALVTIVEFAEFQCPFSKRVQDTLKRVRDTYGDKVRIVWKNEPLPFHPRAEPAAELAEYAFKHQGNAGFWAAHDRLFGMQPALEDTELENAARELGLDAGAVLQAVHGRSFKNAIENDIDLADDLKVSGTPHFFINGRRLLGAQPFEKFQAVIDDRLEVAKSMVARGTPAKRVYEQIMKAAAGPEPPERKQVPLPAHAVPFKGGPRAKVVIQEFSDFQCQFCRRARSTMSDVLSTYGNKVKIIFRQMPLPMHADAALAAEASLEAYKQKGVDGFWTMHDLLFDNQENADGLKQAALESYASRMGLDVKAFRTALESRSHRTEVEADRAAAEAASISGTPAFVINGYFISGAQPFAKFRKIIDRALAEAK